MFYHFHLLILPRFAAWLVFHQGHIDWLRSEGYYCIYRVGPGHQITLSSASIPIYDSAANVIQWPQNVQGSQPLVRRDDLKGLPFVDTNKTFQS
jgi:hypothetical protein